MLGFAAPPLASYDRMVTLRVPRRSSAFLLVWPALLILACSGSAAEPAPLDQAARIHVQTRVSTEFYPVRGSTAEAIFAYLARNGPTNEAGERGTGLTSARWTYSWQGRMRGSSCRIESMTISLDIKVVLPRHETPESLKPATLERWLGFAQGVAAHEQRHVEIHLEGADSIEARMEAIEPQPSCDVLEAVVARAWNEEQAIIDARQAAFHREEDLRLQQQRAPVEAKIVAARTTLGALLAEEQALTRDADALRREIDALQAQIATSKSQLDLILRAYAGGIPPDVFPQYQLLTQRYSSQVERHNTLVERYNALVARQASLHQEIERLQAEIADLVDAYNWMR